MTFTIGPDGKPALFTDLPAEKFPVQMVTFDPQQELVWRTTVEPYVATPIPGLAETGKAVRYLVLLYADGTAQMHDDPTCSGLFDEPHERVVLRTALEMLEAEGEDSLRARWARNVKTLLLL